VLPGVRAGGPNHLPHPVVAHGKQELGVRLKDLTYLLSLDGTVALFFNSKSNSNPHNMTSQLAEQPSQAEEYPLYKGSCQCGFVTYTVRLNLSTPSILFGPGGPSAILTKVSDIPSRLHFASVKSRRVPPSIKHHSNPEPQCNCSVCHKSGTLLAAPAPRSSFTLLSPTEGLGALTDYTFNLHKIHHHFCPKCGIKCFLSGDIPANGNILEFKRINVLTIDGREDGKPMEELKDVKVKFWDGREGLEGFKRGLGDEPWSFGVW
jgi:hypothetical protein